MNRRFGRSAILAALCFAAAATASQAEDIRIRRVSHSVLNTPSYNMDLRQPTARARRWVQLECQFDTREDWTDDLEFTFYVLLRSDNPREPLVLLTGTVAYVHVPAGRQHVSWFYIHPNVIARFGAVEGVAVELRQRGRPIAAEASSAQHRQQYRQWIERLPAREGLLMLPADTPFAMYAPDLQQMIRQRQQ